MGIVRRLAEKGAAGFPTALFGETLLVVVKPQDGRN
jgi:hypothetical protein